MELVKKLFCISLETNPIASTGNV